MRNYLFALLILSLTLTSCTENYSNGERIGMVTQFSKKGWVFDSWEGHLNITQTGMNSSTGFDFSVDNDVNDPRVIAMLDSAANNGWKVKLLYHQVGGFKNVLRNRGDTDHFIKDVIVLDRSPVDHLFGGEQAPAASRDTVYVLTIDGRQFELSPIQK